ncbi:hypothetical protein MJO28_016397 [Puccinia striiformis f. sp. tritici]|uniref:Uncharacterized protein n=1 Tax=Puccinia striiformis f. sp. tritici TaxID=168172 RepID=A0ACC0DNV8_9BASI|nr:hypothetical protein Pst134EB_031017 [Puccinia striiformis f. sp. tritici]KAI7934970.1 hypothetical protein MJO29_016233 [Puccinia striiformis f. sp. tritici]KAI7935526.1 hypothetical protein MJO28_016397 [Puccinia striiformis f. sp. tritici]
MYDDKVVRQSDTGNHFFLDQKSIGQNRSKECCRLLNELGSSKSGAVTWNDELLDEWYYESMEDTYGFWGWNAFICVRSTPNDESINCQFCWECNVPTILVQTCGLVASIRVLIREQRRGRPNLLTTGLEILNSDDPSWAQESI